MKFDIITIFPGMFDSYINEAMINRAQKNGLLTITTHNLRDYTLDPHQKIDDSPYGGGPGMVYMIEPVVRALEGIKKAAKTKVILTTPRGKQFNQKMAKTLSKQEQIVFVCPRYEGIDERIKKYIDMEVSIGPYVLNGGEIAAMTMIEAISRYIPGMLGKKESLDQESHSQEGVLEYPQYTRPEVFRGSRVPKVLLSGNHKKIEEWRASRQKTV